MKVLSSKVIRLSPVAVCLVSCFVVMTAFLAGCSSTPRANAGSPPAAGITQYEKALNTYAEGYFVDRSSTREEFVRNLEQLRDVSGQGLPKLAQQVTPSDWRQADREGGSAVYKRAAFVGLLAQKNDVGDVHTLVTGFENTTWPMFYMGLRFFDHVRLPNVPALPQQTFLNQMQNLLASFGPTEFSSSARDTSLIFHAYYGKSIPNAAEYFAGLPASTADDIAVRIQAIPR